MLLYIGELLVRRHRTGCVCMCVCIQEQSNVENVKIEDGNENEL